MKLVRRRGTLMAEAGLARPGAMAAILGGLARPIEEACAEAKKRTAGEVVPANYNAPEQVVISGEVAGVEQAMELAKAAGAKRAMRLNVSGAFHSPLMAPASEGLDLALSGARWTDPSFPVYSNVRRRGSGVRTSRASCLPSNSPRRCAGEVVRAMAAEHPGALFVEMGPGNVLTGLLKRLAPRPPRDDLAAQPPRWKHSCRGSPEMTHSLHPS